MGNGQWAIGNRQWAISEIRVYIKQQAMDNRRPLIV